MSQTHLSDEMIQELTWDAPGTNIPGADHLKNCALCQQRVADYRAIFGVVQELPQARFSFDLSAVVRQRLTEINPAPRTISEAQYPADTIYRSQQRKSPPASAAPAWLFVLMLLLIPSIAIGLMYYFGFDLSQFKTSLPSVSIALIVVSVILILILLITEEYRKYQKQIDSIKF